ncbi:MAG TPA: YciI family protein [Oculatellaceae cyanobacterium]|jgi:hypothetical protein
MRFVVFVRATEDSEKGIMPPDPQLMEAMGKFNQQLIDAGVMVAGDGFKPTSQGVRIAFSGQDRTVRKGPFPVNETIAGYWIWQLNSLEEAIEWAKRCPNPMPGPSEIEIRPIYEEEDFQ